MINDIIALPDGKEENHEAFKIHVNVFGYRNVGVCFGSMR